MIKIKKIYSDLKDICSSSYKITGIKKGFGNTLGNSLRRTMISNTPGLSIYAYYLSCFSHDFDKSKNIVEDAGEIMYKMRDVVIQYNPDVQEEVIEIELSGPKEVKAEILETESIKIVNKDYVLFNMSGKVKLTLRVFIKNDVGFVIHQENAKNITAELVLACTSFHSRIEKVNYKVEVDEISEDKDEILHLTVESAKSYDVDFILKNAIEKIINEFNSLFEGIDREIEVENTESKEANLKMNNLLDQIIEDKELYRKIINMNSLNIEELIDRLSDAKIQKQLGLKKMQIKELLIKIKETFEINET